jgi:anti-anti-sigma regulatory factor
MLRITIEDQPRETTFRLEGRLTGPWVEELERVWRSSLADPATAALAVDLTDVTFVGEDGKKLLEEMYVQGAKLKTSRCATRSIVEEIGHNFKRVAG